MDQDTIRIAIGGMHCGACVRRVTMALGKLEGVEVVTVDVGSAELKLTGSGAMVEKVIDAVERIGFKAALA